MERREDALLLPAAALLDEPGKSVRTNGSNTPGKARVWIVEQGRALQKRVTLGALSNGHYEVLDGLAPRARVVVEGGNLLKAGAAVKVAKENAPKGDEGKPLKSATGPGK